jgi:hypothetical protein
MERFGYGDIGDVLEADLESQNEIPKLSAEIIPDHVPGPKSNGKGNGAPGTVFLSDAEQEDIDNELAIIKNQRKDKSASTMATFNGMIDDLESESPA